MADCFSLPNAAELVEQLRSASELGDAPAFNEFGVIVSKSTAQHAAGTIEAMMQENAKLKAERGAAVADLKYYGYCKNCSQCTTKYGFYLCKIHGTVYWNDTCDDWEWRGIQKEGEMNG